MLPLLLIAILLVALGISWLCVYLVHLGERVPAVRRLSDLAVPLLSLPALGSFAYVLFGGGLIATLFWNLGVQKAGASLSAIFLNIMPVVGMLGGWLVFSESISPAKAIGAAAIFLGVYLTTHSGTKLTS